MKECSGMFGKVFGHKVESLIKKYTPQPLGSYDGCRLEEIINANAVKEYEILCVRCGRSAQDLKK